jgi:hypothetical protein
LFDEESMDEEQVKRTSEIAAGEYPKERNALGRFIKGGRSPNPWGKPKGVRHKLTEAVLDDVVRDWRDGGAEAVARTRKENPAAYMNAVLRLIPREVLLALDKPADQQNDSELLLTLFNAINRVKDILVRLRELPGGPPLADEIELALSGQGEEEPGPEPATTRHGIVEIIDDDEKENEV